MHADTAITIPEERSSKAWFGGYGGDEAIRFHRKRSTAIGVTFYLLTDVESTALGARRNLSVRDDA